MAKVHIILSAEALQSPEALQETLTCVRELMGLDGVNERRLTRYGMLSGTVRTEDLPTLRTVPGVEAVEVDQIRRAL